MRTFLINVAVFLGLCATAYFLVPLVDLIRMGAGLFIHPTDHSATLPNYAGVPWAKRHFQEISELRTEYVSFLGWRRLPFSGQTITIEAPLNIRRTPEGDSKGSSRTVYFFGGSAMWGVGSDDAHTIPALFQQLAGGHAVNFAESGWIAHQSLNQLMKLYTEGHHPDVVVFYDGFNDVRLKCRAGADFWADEREARVRQAVRYYPYQAGYYLQPLLYAATQLRSQLRGKESDCDSDPRKAKLIARQMLADWKIAAMLVAAHGGVFRAYLQPVAFYSHSRTDHLPPNPDMRRQFDAVYGQIRAGMAALSFAADLAQAMDQDAYVFLDAVHVSPNGSAAVARRMAADLQ